MDQSIPSSKETNKTENDSFDRKGLSDVETTASSDVSSFYEINVHENFSSESNTSKGSSYFYVRPKLMVKVKKVGGSKESKENNHNTHMFVENLKKIANPLIESYYPFLEDNQIGNITIEVNVSPLNSDGKESGKKKENMDKSVMDEKGGENPEDSTWNKSSESASGVNTQDLKEERKLAVSSFNKIRKKIKQQILQDMLMKKDGELKDVEWKDVEEDQLHIHHHEHHHHYYMDTAKFKDESEFSLLRNSSNSPVHWSEDKENEFRRSDVLNTDFDVKERERANYLYDCSHQHPVNFLMEKNSCNLSNMTFVRRSKEEYMKIADKYSSRSGPIKPMKKASSMDSLSRKKSDLIVFHNYSDTEVSKCDSEEGSFTDVLSSRSTINLSRNMKKGTKTENKRSKLLWQERDVVAGNVIQGSDSTCTVLKKICDEECDERKKSFSEMEKINKKPGNLPDLVGKFKTSEVRNEDSKGEFEILVAKKIKKSVEIDESGKQTRNYFTRPVCILSSEGEPVDIQTDKETSDENVKSTTTITTSAKDTATVVEISEEGSCNSHRKFSRSSTPKSAGNSGDKMRSSSRKKIDNNQQVALKSKQTFGISGNSKSKGVVRCYYSCSRNRECNITLTIEKNRKQATESSKSSESSNKKKKERSSAN